MFYSAQILSRKGPLGTCWLASWSQRGLKRNEVFNCSLPAAVDSIINPEAPLALRLSGQLLLGLVRLYLRRLQFLEEDAGLALRGLARNAAAAGQPQVDLPDGGVAPEMAITLQDGGYDPMAQFVGNELFPSFESSLFGEGDLGGGYGDGGYSAGGASLTVAQDISELFGSRWGGPDGEERFDVDGDAVERRFSTELERLRSQGVEAPRDRADMFFGGGAEEAFSPAVAIEDEIMAVPPEDMFAGPGPTPRKTPGKTPLSAGGAPLPGLSDMRITPPSLPGGADLLPDIGATGASGGTTGGDGGFPGGMYDEEAGAPVLLPLDLEAAAEEAGEAAAATEAGAAAAGQVQQVAARRRAAATGPRRRKPTVDSGRDGRPATTLPSGEIRSLLADRKPLLTRRGRRTRRRGAVAPPGMFDVVAQSDAARESELFRPSSFSALCPELLELFGHALALPASAAAADGTPGAGRRRRSSRGTVAADEEAAAAVAAAAEVAAEGELPPLQEEEPPLSAGFTAGGPPSEFGAFSAGGSFAGGSGFEPEDPIEPADTQQEQQATAAGLFATARDGEQDAEADAAGLAQRHGRGPLQPVPYSGELPGELGSIGPDSTSGGAASGSSDAAAQHATAFTRNTALVLEHLRREFAPSTGSKRRHPGSHGDLAAGMAALSLDSLLLGGAAPRGRLDAARWFYECLVLRNTGFVQLEQGDPYGDIAIAPTPLLTGGSAVAGGTPAGGAPAAP